jgi:uncharacterized membrane protein YhhN
MWALGVAGVAIVGGAHLGARYASRPGLAAALKGVPIALLAALVAGEPAAVDERYRWLIVAGLLCSLVGDLCLTVPTGFVPGLASFLVAHLVYTAAFLPGGHDGVALLAPFALVGGLMLALLWRHLGRDKPAVAVYVAAIVVMGWRAAVRAETPTTPSPSDALALVGAVLFMASDGILAFDRFVGRFAAADAAVMTTYYAAQSLIALSTRA